jgi:hypothetical protein
MTREILLRLPWENESHPVQLSVARQANTFAINLTAGRHKPIWLYGSPKALVPWLRELLEKLESQSDYNEPPDAVEEEIPPADPDGRHLTVAMLADKPTEEKLALMIEYFNAAPPDKHDPYLVTALMQDYRAATDKPYKPRRRDEVGRVIEVLRPHVREYMDKQGHLIRGAKTRAAERAGYSQSGGYYGKVVTAALDALAEEQRRAA